MADDGDREQFVSNLHVQRLKQALEAIDGWRADTSSTCESPGFADWRDRVQDSLGQLLPDRDYAKRFTALAFRDFSCHTNFVPAADRALFSPPSQRSAQSHPRSPDHRGVFEQALATAKSLIRDALEEHERASQVGASSKPAESNGASNEGHKRNVAVVYGRNTHAKDGVFHFLRALGLAPVEFAEASRKTSATPYVGQAVDMLFTDVQAVVVILSGDEDVSLRKALCQDASDAAAGVQSRPNVFFELGLAFAKHPTRTLILQIGEHRSVSDLAGRYIVRFTGDADSRNDARSRLENAGCVVKVNSDWLKAGQGDIERALGV